MVVDRGCAVEVSKPPRGRREVAQQEQAAGAGAKGPDSIATAHLYHVHFSLTRCSTNTDFAMSCDCTILTWYARSDPGRLHAFGTIYLVCLGDGVACQLYFSDI